MINSVNSNNNVEFGISRFVRSNSPSGIDRALRQLTRADLPKLLRKPSTRPEGVGPGIFEIIFKLLGRK